MSEFAILHYGTEGICNIISSKTYLVLLFSKKNRRAIVDQIAKTTSSMLLSSFESNVTKSGTLSLCDPSEQDLIKASSKAWADIKRIPAGICG